MAPTTSDLDSHESSFLYSFLPVMNLRRRDASGNSTLSTSTVAGFAAVIAVLSAIILGYIAYRLFKRYQARGQPTHRPATSPTSLTGSTRLKHGVEPTEITITGSNYNGYPSMAQSKHGHSHSHSQSQHQAADFSIDPHTANTNAGSKTPNLDWRPPVLTPWSKHSLHSSDSDIEAQQRQEVAVHASGSNSSIPYPSQAYAAHGRKRGPDGGVFGFMRNAANGFASGGGGGGRRKGDKGGDEGVYLMVGGGNSPPVGSPPPQYVTKNAAGKRSFDSNRTVQQNGMPEETVGAYLRAHGGAMSPPLPPLPSTTPDILRKSSDRQAPSAYSNAAAGPSGGKSVPAPINVAPPRSSSSSSRPLSRVPTKKSSRLTASSSLNGHGGSTAVPSPRVSSLYRSSTRLSHHHPASPGLPNPPIPPMPAIPAHLQHLSRSTSTSRTGSTAGSLDVQPKHASSLSAASTVHAAGDTSVVIGPDGPEDPTKGPDGKPLPRTMVVTCTFTPSMSDELPLTIGETVSMLEEYIDEWCFVQRVRVMIKEGGQRAGIEVGVHGTVDVQNTVVVPVPGEGNLGAVPRFCLSEWPLALTEEDEEEEEEGQEPITLGQETPTGLPMFTPPAILPSPPSSSTTPTFLPGKHFEAARQPLIAPGNSYSQSTPTQSRPRPLPTPTPKLPAVIPEESLDSKFSSWGSTSTNMPLPMQTFSGLGSSTPGQQQNLGANSIHPLANDSRTPSVSSAATSVTAPIPPPTSPVSQSPVVISPAEEDDNIKRVSKPPLAPRASRFPASLDEEAPTMPANLPNLLGRSIGHGHSRNNSRSNASGMTAEGGIPRAAERTVTMPPLPRRPSETDPSTADTPTTTTPTFQLSHTISDYSGSRNGSNTSLNNANNANSNIAGMKEANAHWAGVYTSKEHNAVSGTGMNTPSTSAAETPSTGAGTSAGSKTPSTAASALTASSSNNYSPPGKAGFGARPPGPMGSSGNLSYGARALPSAQDKKGGAGKVNIKSLRTGSMMGSSSVPR